MVYLPQSPVIAVTTVNMPHHTSHGSTGEQNLISARVIRAQTFKICYNFLSQTKLVVTRSSYSFIEKLKQNNLSSCSC